MATKQQYVWLDGKFIRYEDAKFHLLTHSLQYGSGMFEGIRCYKTANGPSIFRLKEHIKRFVNSIQIYAMPLHYTEQQLYDATKAIVKKNGLEEAYIRPFVFYSNVGIGLSVKGKDTSIAIAALYFGPLFGAGHDKGITCKTSSWARINSSILPAGAKASANYANSVLASKEANDAGYDEAILLSNFGKVLEGPGENIFVVQDNMLITPPKSSDILVGITRDSVIKIAENMGLEVEERDIRKEELYISDEVFFTGTAAEITPIVSVDSRKVGGAKPGPITTMLSGRYSKIVRGEDKEFEHWLTYL